MYSLPKRSSIMNKVEKDIFNSFYIKNLVSIYILKNDKILDVLILKVTSLKDLIFSKMSKL